LNYLCPAYKRFFNHIDPGLRLMAQLLRNGHAAADIMEILAAQAVAGRQLEISGGQRPR
jgi:uncharacterized protein